MAQSLWQLRGAVRNVKPNCPVELADQLLNRHIQGIVKKHRWADTLTLGTIVVPDAYTTGLVTTTPGSALITGLGTGWPVNDAVNTTLSAASKGAPGVCDLKLTDLSGIGQGDYLLLDQENPGSMEVVVVSYVGPDKITARCRFNHAQNASVQKSSLANLQIHLGNNQVTTVKVVYSPTSLEMEQRFGGPALVATPYWIYMAYGRVSATAQRIIDAIDPVSGNAIGVGKTMQWLNALDPQRTSTSAGATLELVSMPPNLGGVMQWELYPAQTSACVIPILYVDGWPKLASDNDLSPYFINEEIFVSLATGDALLTKNISERGKIDPYYDPIAARHFITQGQQWLEEAWQADSGRYMTAVQSYREQLRSGSTLEYEASHLPGWPVEE